MGSEGKLQHVSYGNRATDDALSPFRLITLVPSESVGYVLGFRLAYKNSPKRGTAVVLPFTDAWKLWVAMTP